VYPRRSDRARGKVKHQLQANLWVLLEAVTGAIDAVLVGATMVPRDPRRIHCLAPPREWPTTVPAHRGRNEAQVSAVVHNPAITSHTGPDAVRMGKLTPPMS
jgi:hypothetical protein